MSILIAILQGIIQGLTEFLPISSSGHLSLFQHFTGQNGEGSLFFTVMLHIGTMMAVIIRFFRTILNLIAEFFRMLFDILTGKFRFKEANPMQRMVIMILLALLPLIPFYLIKDVFTQLAEDDDILVEGVCFLITGGLLILADRCVRGNKAANKMKGSDALLIGTFQGIAALPGVSRSGSTIAAGLLSGLSDEYAVEFSFILGVPVILATSALEMRDALRTDYTIEILPLIVGVVTSFVVGLGAIKLISWLIKKGRFAVFAYYTLTLGFLVLIAGVIELLTGNRFMLLF